MYTWEREEDTYAVATVADTHNSVRAAQTAVGDTPGEVEPNTHIHTAE
jgi:hypothetical protein